MPFGLINAGATYQRLVNKMFDEHIGKTMEVYVDDIVVKSSKKENHLEHLAQVFEILRAYNMKLNPKKSSFGVHSGKFLGHLVSQRGIEANPTKVKAIIEMQPPRSVKEMQRLTGCLAALNRFISRSGDRCRPFFEAIKKGKFQWTENCQRAFDQLKEYLSDTKILAKPVPGEKLFLYLAASEVAISSVLVRAEGKFHVPIYYVSQALHEAEIRYSPTEKLAYALVMSVRKLRPYFFDHQVEVLTTFPLKQILHRPDTAGRLLKWSLEISQFGISYAPRTAIKGQALADFIVELTFPQDPTRGHNHPWHMYVDGSSTNAASGAGIVLISPDRQVFTSAVRFEFMATNNEAEYEALIAGLRLALAVGVRRLQIFGDSQLIVNQVRGEYEAKDENMALYQKIVAHLASMFEQIYIEQIPRDSNSQADALARLATSTGPAELSEVIITKITNPSTNDYIVNQVDEVMEEDDWRIPIIKYLQDGEQPENPVEASKIVRRAARHTMLDGHLYKRGFSIPLLRCLTRGQGLAVLKEIHEGVCGNHAGGRALAYKTVRQGYYWPTLLQDAIKVARTCHRCQLFAPNIHQPPHELISVNSPWPFAKWGIDIIGPFPPGKGNVRFAVVGVDYFTKWAEAEALVTITQEKMINFIWKNIVCRFGVPQAIVTDNGKQFEGKKIREFCLKWGIKKHFSTPYHPQSNGQVEAVNKIIKHILKIRLTDKKGTWSEELPEVLWAYRVSHRASTGETPFSLAFGIEAVIPVELKEQTRRTAGFDEEANNSALATELDLLEEKRITAEMKNAIYKRRIAKYYNTKVKERDFEVGDLVLRKILGQPTGVFGPTWEGPFKITNKWYNGTYDLEDMEGNSAQYSWNAALLKKYYQ